MEFELLDDITRADIAFRAYGKNLNELFISGARALMSIMLQNPEDIAPKKTLNFKLEHNNLELLFYDFLQEFIFYKDSELLLLLPKDVMITESQNGYNLSCKSAGEIIDRKKHIFNTDIKAVTMHNLLVEKGDKKWSATAVLDV